MCKVFKRYLQKEWCLGDMYRIHYVGFYVNQNEKNEKIRSQKAPSTLPILVFILGGKPYIQPKAKNEKMKM